MRERHDEALAAVVPGPRVEGEFDALTVAQVAGDLIAGVALGSNAGARRPGRVEAPAACSLVLVGLGSDLTISTIASTIGPQ